MACPMLRAATGLMLVGSPILTVSLKVLPILAEIPRVLKILVCFPLWGVGLCIAGTAAHDSRQHSDFENSA